MEVPQWIFKWEYVKKNGALKLTNMMSCFSKTADIRTTEGGEGICLLSAKILSTSIINCYFKSQCFNEGNNHYSCTAM